MVDGQQRAWWRHTCEIVAIVAEVNRNKKKRSRPFTGLEEYFRRFPDERPLRPKNENGNGGIHVWQICDALGI